MNQAKEFLRLWGICVGVLFLPYCALYILGYQPASLPRVLAAVAIGAFAFALLLHADRKVARFDTAQTPTAWWLIHELFVRRQSLLAAMALAVAALAFAVYYVSASLFSVEYTAGSAVTIRVPGETVYHLPVTPYGQAPATGGWENTKIPLTQGEVFTVEVSGNASPGFLQNLDARQRNMEETIAWENNKRAGAAPIPPSAIAWDFTGPTGYFPEWYPGGANRRPYIGRDFQDDPGLTIQGAPHNTLFGIVIPDGQLPPRRAAWDGSVATPGYNLRDSADSRLLVNLSSREYPVSLRSPATGSLWVVINDADGFRWDNAGFFFLKVIRHRGFFSRQRTE